MKTKVLSLFMLGSMGALAQGVTIQAPVFTGSGLNDAASCGRFLSAAQNSGYVVTLSATGAPDQFTWTKNGGSPSAPIAITGACQIMADGVGVQFAATTGHQLGDPWTISAAAQGSISGSTFVQAGNGAIVRRNAEDKLRDVVSLLDFVDADPTGTVSSVPALEAAFARARGPVGMAGARIEVPCGTYMIDSQVDIGYGFMLELAGQGCTYFEWKGPPAGPMFRDANCYQCKFSNFRILTSAGYPLQAAMQTLNDGTSRGYTATRNVFDHIQMELGSVAQVGVLIAGPSDNNNDQQRFTDVTVVGATQAAWMVGLTPSPISIASASWGSGAATYDIANLTSYGITTGDTVAISGASPGGYNATGVATLIDATHLSIPVASNPGAWSSGGALAATNRGFNIFNVVMDHSQFDCAGGNYGVQEGEGSFMWINGGDSGGCFESDFYIGQPQSGGYKIEYAEFEGSAAFLTSGGPGGISANLTVSHITWASYCAGQTNHANFVLGCPGWSPTGSMMSWGYFGPFRVSNSTFGAGGSGNPLTVSFSQAQSGPTAAIFEDDIFSSSEVTLDSLFIHNVPTCINCSWTDSSGGAHRYTDYIAPATVFAESDAHVADFDFSNATTANAQNVNVGTGMRYSTGLADVVNGSTTVQGEGTGWLNSMSSGGTITIPYPGGSTYGIAGIGQPNQLALSSAFTGTTAQSINYLIQWGAPGLLSVGNQQGQAETALSTGTGNRAAPLEIGNYQGIATPIIDAGGPYNGGGVQVTSNGAAGSNGAIGLTAWGKAGQGLPSVVTTADGVHIAWVQGNNFSTYSTGGTVLIGFMSQTITAIADSTHMTVSPGLSSGYWSADLPLGMASLLNCAVTACYVAGGINVGSTAGNGGYAISDASGNLFSGGNPVAAVPGTIANGQLVVGTATPGQLAGGNLTGDVTTSGGLATILTTVVSAGSAGDSTHIPQITVDAKGRVTSLGSAAVGAVCNAHTTISPAFCTNAACTATSTITYVSSVTCP